MIFFSFLEKYHQKSLDYSLALLVFFVPLSYALPNILLIPAGLFYIYKIYLKKRVNFSLPWLLGFFLLLLILVLAFVHGDLISEIDFQKKFITALLVILLIKEVSKLRLIEISFVIGVITAILYNLGHIAFKYYQGINLDFSFGTSVYELLLFNRPYLAFLTVLANFIIFKWIRKNGSAKYYLLGLLPIAFCFFITARLGMVLHVLLIFHHIFRSSQQIKFKHILLSVLICGIFGFILLKNPYLKERFRIQSNFSETYKKYRAYEIRFIIWECSFETLADNWGFGIQSHENLIPVMTDCYVSKIEPHRTKKINYYKNEKFNTHNQFLDIWLIAGLPGLSILIAVFIVPFIKQKKYSEMLTVLVLFFLFMLVENIFQRQIGCFLFGIFMGLYAPKDVQLTWSK